VLFTLNKDVIFDILVKIETDEVVEIFVDMLIGIAVEPNKVNKEVLIKKVFNI